MKEYGFGVDVGGMTCKFGLFKQDGTLLEKWDIATDTSDNGSHILKDISVSIAEKMRQRELTKEDIQGIGMGVPGAVETSGIVNRCNNLGWGVVDAGRELSEYTGLSVRVANDANLAALGEAWMGSGKDYTSLAMVTLGTGVGGGIILNGKIVNGYNGVAGEIGHINVNPHETKCCTCGNSGCLEQYVAAPGIVRMARERMEQEQIKSELSKIRNLTAKDVFDAAKNEDRLAEEVIKRVCSLLGGAIAIICNVINPEVVLIGGGVSRAGEIILKELAESFQKGAFHACKNTKICLASLGNDAGIYGGMKLILDEENQ